MRLVPNLKSKFTTFNEGDKVQFNHAGPCTGIISLILYCYPDGSVINYPTDGVVFGMMTITDVERRIYPTAGTVYIRIYFDGTPNEETSMKIFNSLQKA